MITISEILDAFQHQLLVDADFTAWCLANVGVAPLVQIGESAQSPLGEADAPAVILHPGEYNQGQEAAMFRLTIGVDWLCICEGRTEIDRGVTYTGVNVVDTFGQQIYLALQRVSDNIALSRVSYVLDPVLSYPLFSGGMDIEIDIPNVIGGSIGL
jgi:hypothetical protein